MTSHSASPPPSSSHGAGAGGRVAADGGAKWWLGSVDLSLVVVTDRGQARRPLLDVVKAALDGGARTFLLREKDLPRHERLELARAMRSLGAFVIVAGRDPLEGNGVHLSAFDAAVDPRAHAATDPRAHAAVDPRAHAATDQANGPAVAAMLTGRSCHGEAEVMASKEDYVTLSPIFPTSSKPGYGPALGLGALSIGEVLTSDGPLCRLRRHETHKILGLGGIETPAQATACREAGAIGVAVMGAIMRSPDPAMTVKGLLS